MNSTALLVAIVLQLYLLCRITAIVAITIDLVVADDGHRFDCGVSVRIVHCHIILTSSLHRLRSAQAQYVHLHKYKGLTISSTIIGHWVFIHLHIVNVARRTRVSYNHLLLVSTSNQLIQHCDMASFQTGLHRDWIGIRGLFGFLSIQYAESHPFLLGSTSTLSCSCSAIFQVQFPNSLILPPMYDTM